MQFFNPKSAINLLLVVFLSLSFVIVGCEDDDDEVIIDEGFIADVGSFANFTSWELIDYTIYPTVKNLLGPAHAGNDSSVARMVFKHANASVSNGMWTRGSIIGKETFAWSGGQKVRTAAGVLGMVKRAGDFYPNDGGWEYFNLGSAGTEIMGRGGDLNANGCMNCHEKATGTNGTDYIFKHRAEYAVAIGSEWDMFKDALSWIKVDSKFGPDPFLGQAHGITDDLTRDVYVWQPAAKYAAEQFPVGTFILKEVYSMVDDEKVYPHPAGGELGDGAWTAMVKRGGEFNSEYGYWEWFVINPLTHTVARGADLKNNACNSCHNAAGTGADNGGDLVFYHPDMGFQM